MYHEQFEMELIDKKMNQNLETRHNYLTFAYTSSVALLAALFSIEQLQPHYLISLLPFVAIIPFQARISYSRLSHAKMEAYVKVFHGDKMKFYNNSIDELRSYNEPAKKAIGEFIAALSNFELTILSVAITICFFILRKECMDVLGLAPIALSLIVAGLSIYSYNYKGFLDEFEAQYGKIKEAEEREWIEDPEMK